MIHMSYTIEKKFFNWVNPRSLVASKYIIAHEAGNPNNTGADSLDREISAMNNGRSVFVSHWVGGGGRIVQTAPVGKLQYGCGPNGNPYSYAQVEIARTNNKARFKQDYAAYIWLLRKLAHEAGVECKLDNGMNNGIKTHEWVTTHLRGTTHVDPYSYLASMGISRSQFAKDIANGLEEETPEKDWGEEGYYVKKHDMVEGCKSFGLYSDKDLKNKVATKDAHTILVVESLEKKSNGCPVFKVRYGAKFYYMTANKDYVLHREFEDLYFTSKKDKLVTLTSAGLYKDVDLKTKVDKIKKNTRFEILQLAHKANGCPVFKVKGGYITANRNNVKAYTDK